MKRLSKLFLAVLLLTVASVGWAVCPEGTKQSYTGLGEINTMLEIELTRLADHIKSKEEWVKGVGFWTGKTREEEWRFRYSQIQLRINRLEHEIVRIQDGRDPTCRPIVNFRSMRLDRRGCYGRCPSFFLHIERNGSATYFGGSFTNVRGERSFMLTKDQLESISNEFERIDFFSIPTHCCDCNENPDFSSITIIYDSDYGSARINAYGGKCTLSGDWGRKLHELEQRILGITKIGGWNG